MILRKSCIILLSLFLLSGCWDSEELQDLSIITAAAIDLVEDDKIQISVQIFIPRAITTGQTGEDPSAGSTFIREGTGDSLAEAVSKLQSNVPRVLFWGQCKIFIMGNELAKKGIQKEVDYLLRHPAPRGFSYIYVSEEKARDILMLVPPLERYSAEALRKLSTHESGIDSTLIDVDTHLMGESQAVALPLVKPLFSPEKARQENETIPTITGTAIFKKDKMVGQLNMEETRGLMWLLRKIKKSTLSIKPEGYNEEIIMMPTIGKIKFKPLIEKGRWIMNVDLVIRGDIVQNETNMNLFNEQIIERLQNEFEAVLKERVSQTIKKLQHEFHTDPIEFGRRFHQKYPEEWKKVKNHWDEKFSEVDIKIHVDATIRTPGDIGPPAAFPHDEVVK